ncbi:MAG: hypothetical protein ACLQQ4_11730 [Bacteroidia bacterium]
MKKLLLIATLLICIPYTVPAQSSEKTDWLFGGFFTRQLQYYGTGELKSEYVYVPIQIPDGFYTVDITPESSKDGIYKITITSGGSENNLNGKYFWGVLVTRNPGSLEIWETPQPPIYFTHGGLGISNPKTADNGNYMPPVYILHKSNY